MVFLILQGNLLTGTFVSRPNRFTAIASVRGDEVRCHLPNPGRMVELLVPGARVVLEEAAGGRRRTRFDLIAVYTGDMPVSIDSRLPNRLILEALRERELEGFTQYTVIRPEYAYDHARIDFFLSNGGDKCLLEVKSCTLVKNRVALFPDAPTSRGQRHLLDLMKAKREGYRACILFLVQRTDANVFSPNDETDREFAESLRKAAIMGVEVYAYRSELKGNKISLGEKVVVKLEGAQF